MATNGDSGNGDSGNGRSYHLPAFLEMSSDDLVSTRRFLESVFGWRFAPSSPAPSEEFEFEMPDGGQGKLRSVPSMDRPDRIDRIRVYDIQAALERGQRAGGTLVLPRVEAPGLGSFFAMRIPGGPIITCWQSAPPLDR
jgi:uncharacterized protein